MTIAFRLRAVGTNAGSVLRPDFTDSALEQSAAALRDDFVNRVFLGTTDGTSALLKVTANTYTSTQVTWSIDDSVITWTEAWIVRNSLGVPASTHDGTLVQYIVPASHLTSFQDPGLAGGRWYYYSLYARVPGAAPAVLLLASAQVLVPEDFGTGDYLWNRVPERYRLADLDEGSGGPGPLRKFLRVIGFEVDNERAMAATLFNARAIERTPGSLLPMMGEMLGVPYENQLSMARYRSLVNRILELRQYKGTATALKDYVEVFSGYRASIGAGVNLMLSQDDAEGNTNTTASWLNIVGASTVDVATAAGGPVSATYWVVTATTSPSPGPWAMMLGQNIGDFVPVIPNTNYAYSVYWRTITGNLQVSQRVEFYNQYGTFITTGTSTITTVNANSWQRTEFDLTTPPSAVFMRIGFNLPNILATQSIYFGGIQVERGTAATDYEVPRLVTVTLEPTRTNLASNPKFADLSWWNLPSGAAGSSIGTTSAVRLVSNGVAQDIGTPLVVVEAGRSYTLSFTTSSPVISTIGFNSEFFQDAQGAGGDNLAPATPLSSGPYSIPVGENRVVVSGIDIPSEVLLARFTLSIVNASTVKMTNVLIERDSTEDYFDGDTDTSGPGDFWWAASNDTSVSYYSPNKVVVMNRLVATVPDWLPYGMTAIVGWDLSSNQAPVPIAGGPFFTIGDPVNGVIGGTAPIRA